LSPIASAGLWARPGLCSRADESGMRAVVSIAERSKTGIGINTLTSCNKRMEFPLRPIVSFFRDLADSGLASD
jgi:hypothetical protein